MHCPFKISEDTQMFDYKEVNEVQMQNPSSVLLEVKTVSKPEVEV